MIPFPVAKKIRRVVDWKIKTFEQSFRYLAPIVKIEKEKTESKTRVELISSMFSKLRDLNQKFLK